MDLVVTGCGGFRALVDGKLNFISGDWLISGFNLEISSLNFIFLFILEYLDIIYFLNLRVIIYLNFDYLIFFLVLFLLFWWKSLKSLERSR